MSAQRIRSLLLFLLVLGSLGCDGLGENDGAIFCKVNEDCEESSLCKNNRCRKAEYNAPPSAKFLVTPRNTKDIMIGNKVLLDASLSQDPEGRSLGFVWSLSVPESSRATIFNSKDTYTNRNSFFVADAPGEYKVTLQVNDGFNDLILTEKTFIAQGTRNKLPDANPGGIQNVAPGTTVTLNGSQSYDPEEEELTFLWTLTSKPDASEAILSEKTLSKPIFTADRIGEYIVSLVVQDGQEAFSQESIAIIKAIPGWDKTPSVESFSPYRVSTETRVELRMEGRDFVEGAKILLANRQFETQFISTNVLVTKMDFFGMESGEYALKAVNPNGKRSNELPLTVMDIPLPKIVSVSPPQTTENARLVLRVKGEGFIEQSVVTFELTELRTTFVSSTELEAELNLLEVAQGEYSLAVKNPGGLKSESILFLIQPKGSAPVLKALNPSQAITGTSIPFSVHGVGFSQGAKIIFAGKEMESVRIRRDEIQAASSLNLSGVEPGNYEVWVENMDRQISNKQIFQVEEIEPTPRLDRILPFVLHIDQEIKLSIYGQNFQKGSKVVFGSKEVSTIFRSSRFLEATVDTSGWTSEDIEAVVLSPNQKKSKSFRVSVIYAPPKIEQVKPNGWTDGCDTEITIFGKNFRKRSILYFQLIPKKNSSTSAYKKTYSENASDPKYKLNVVSEKEIRFNLYKADLLTQKLSSYSVKSFSINVENDSLSASPFIAFPALKYSESELLLTSLSPSWGYAGSIVDIILKRSYRGAKLLPGSQLLLDGNVFDMRCATSGCYDMGARVDLQDTKAGVHEVSVKYPCREGQSQSLPFLVNAAKKPLLGSIEPSFARVGSKTHLRLRGVHIASKHKLYWKASKKSIQTTFVSNTEIVTEKIDFSQFVPGEHELVLENMDKQEASVLFSLLPSTSNLVLLPIEGEFIAGNLYSKVQVQGVGFTNNTKIFFDDVAQKATLLDSENIDIPELNLAQRKEGTAYFYVEDAGQKSNLISVLIEEKPIRVDSISPMTFEGGGASVYVSLYGQNLCPPKSPGSSTCETSKEPEIVITDTKGVDYSKSFTRTFSYTYRVSGRLSPALLREGTYYLSAKSHSGELSNQLIFRVTPPPPPELTRVQPNFVYRGQKQQQVILYGRNITEDDVVIFNNQILNRIPGLLNSTGSTLTIQLDLSAIKVERKFPLYVLRCLDEQCTKTQTTDAVQLDVRHPICMETKDCLIGPANSESCEFRNPTMSGKICVPICANTSDCASLPDAPANLSCVSKRCVKTNTPSAALP